MKRCYYSRIHKIGAIMGIVFFPMLGCFCLFLEIALVTGFADDASIILHVVLCLFLIVAGILSFTLGIPYALFSVRKYELNEKGIVIQYANKYNFFFPWKDMKLVCILRTHKVGAVKPSEVIWCATSSVKHIPPKKTYFNFSWEREFLYRMSILTIEFSEERLEEFKKYYKEGIPDYRYLSD